MPWLIEPELSGVPIARLIETHATIGLVCHACRHRAIWAADDLRRRFPGRPRLTFDQLAPRLRCRACRSEWIQVGFEGSRGPANDDRGR